MEEERLRKEKEGQLPILKENMESLQIQNLQEVETIKRKIENRLNLVTEEAKILKHEKEMEIKIDRIEILAIEIDDIVKRQKRELLRNEEEKEKLKEELMREERLRKEKEGQIAILRENMESLQIQNMETYAVAQRVDEEKEKLKEELMEEERLRKEKEGQIAILKENMESLQI
ncbi:arginine and glutamate-rich protein 1-like [Palaemon carinicauda]|uniref:arginine and glutamate-rich protein 1-like n=1 Tax=Palaemon carinicauda TaxID=392227 RepID=UPI0035B63E93